MLVSGGSALESRGHLLKEIPDFGLQSLGYGMCTFNKLFLVNSPAQPVLGAAALNNLGLPLWLLVLFAEYFYLFTFQAQDKITLPAPKPMVRWAWSGVKRLV